MSDTSTTQPEQAGDEVHPVILRTGDFSDRLSPMLVKELRQGLKGYGFMLLFIAMQAILALYIFGAAFANSYDDTGYQISTVVFFLLCMVTLIAQPLRGMSAISSEIKENTIELMVMTRLSAWRIAFGKWISIVSQSALIIIAVTPYLIVRYFFGGMELFPEIMVLVSIFILSACFTAITVGLSALPSFILRGLASAAIGITVFAVCTEIFDSRRSYQGLLDICGFNSALDTGVYFTLLVSAVYLGWLALDFGASYIAPVAENRATPRRLIALFFILAAICFFILAPDRMKEPLILVVAIFTLPICLISITEPTYLVPNICASFLSRGILFRVSRYLLYPGWQSGIWYALLLYLLAMISMLFLDKVELIPVSAVITITFSCLIFPLAITKLFFRNRQNLFTCYIAVVLASTVLFIVTMMVMLITKVEGLAIFMSWLPPVQYYILAEDAASSVTSSYYYNTNRYTYEFVLGLSLVSLAINWIICLVKSLPEWKEIKKNEETAQQMLADISNQ